MYNYSIMYLLRHVSTVLLILLKRTRKNIEFELHGEESSMFPLCVCPDSDVDCGAW